MKNFELMQVIIHKQTRERRYIRGIDHTISKDKYILTYTLDNGDQLTGKDIGNWKRIEQKDLK